MKPLRRKDRAITDEDALAVLRNAEYGVLSTISDDGTPYGVPLNFCVIDRSLYFHSAPEGRKLDNIKLNKSVSFCAVGHTEVLPEKFSTEYESVIIAGEAEEVFGAEKRTALEGLLHKYTPDFFEQGIKYINTLTEKTRVFKIAISELSGKARRK